MEVCHITTTHPQTDVRIFHKECLSLVKAGYSVSLILANGASETNNGVKIIGVNIPVSGRVERIIKTSNQLYKKVLSLDADVYHFHDPEFLQCALKLKKRGKKVIYDVHEDVPRQILAKFWIPSILRKFISVVFEQYENYVASRLDGIVAATPFIRDRFKRINPNTIDVNNYPILHEKDIFQSATNKERAVCYVGGLDENRGISDLVSAVEKTDVTLHLAGVYDPVTYQQKLKKLEGWKNVTEHGFVDRNEVLSILNSSIAGLVTLKPLINYLDSLPVKMFEYMEAGIPVIASNFPYWKSIIQKIDCGICVDPEDPKAIRLAILELVNNPDRAREMGKRGREAVLAKYNWDIEEQKLLVFYQKVIND